MVLHVRSQHLYLPAQICAKSNQSQPSTGRSGVPKAQSLKGGTTGSYWLLREVEAILI